MIRWRPVGIRCADNRRFDGAPKADAPEKHREMADMAPEMSERRRRKGGSEMVSADDLNLC